ncbi:ABC transporter substrate-binding protein [Seonamhaeicola sp.]|uniref:ABC transporter substrate-binding protein n=1 Tax=Seonamhaeicola sp. TaxID=1912245 RepID=UPI0026305149|nr:ABC transporter substrate-binding protein [Seonamhaeicola sp.]
MRFLVVLVCYFLCLVSCKQEKENKVIDSGTQTEGIVEHIKYAKGFTVKSFEGYKEIKVIAPWPGSVKSFNYLLVKKGTPVPEHEANTVIIQVPVETVIPMSTTNIPVLEYLEADKAIVGFPNTKFISSEKTRKRIDEGDITDLGNDLELNMELLLELKPELVIGFSVNGNNKSLDRIEKFGIPVVLDGAWTEQHPLGRAEWIKFIAAFFDKDEEAKTLFKTIETNYLKAKEMAATVANKPVVLSGSMFKEVWNIPGGKSFVAKYLEDANTDYLWKLNENNGSLQLNFESVLEKAQNAELWIGAGNFDSKSQMTEKHKGYAFFKAFKNNNIYTYTKKKGAEGGLYYYELGPMRPDLILKDIIKIAHPELLTDYETYFFKRLE